MQSLDYIFAAHCAPTFSGIKIASLVSILKDKNINLDKELQKYNNEFSCKGIKFLIIHSSEKYDLVIVYREKELQNRLYETDIKKFLLEYGYKNTNLDSAFLQLSSHFINHDIFPHEIGIFLGYPLYDVKRFIQCKGEDYLFCGYWKVYGDVELAKNLFCEYKNCCKEYISKIGCGIPIFQLSA